VDVDEIPAGVIPNVNGRWHLIHPIDRYRKISREQFTSPSAHLIDTRIAKRKANVFIISAHSITYSPRAKRID
jgi:hypothetical protein